MELRIPRTAVADIEAHALESLPEECCGFLLGREDDPVRVVTEARRATNAEPEMRHVRYTIEPREVLAVEREFRGTDSRLLGFYHSHPENPAAPSAHDAARAWPWYVYAILAVRGRKPGEFRAWTFDEDAAAFHEATVRMAWAP